MKVWRMQKKEDKHHDLIMKFQHQGSTTHSTGMLQFTNKQPIRINIEKLSTKLIEWISSTLQNHTKWKIKYSQSCVV